MRDIYRDEILQSKAWNHAQTWSPEILNGLTGEDVNGKKCDLQNINNMLNQVEDLGDFTIEEWEEFFQTLRLEGI